MGLNDWVLVQWIIVDDGWMIAGLVEDGWKDNGLDGTEEMQLSGWLNRCTVDGRWLKVLSHEIF